MHAFTEFIGYSVTSALLLSWKMYLSQPRLTHACTLFVSNLKTPLLDFVTWLERNVLQIYRAQDASARALRKQEKKHFSGCVNRAFFNKYSLKTWKVKMNTDSFLINWVNVIMSSPTDPDLNKNQMWTCGVFWWILIFFSFLFAWVRMPHTFQVTSFQVCAIGC